jgi:hypothetical protein
MCTPERLGRACAIVRAAGLAVILLVALAATPTNTAAWGCRMYTIAECMLEAECFDQAGGSCGSAMQGCDGLGYIACGYSNCDPGYVTQVCQFPMQE